MTVRPLGCALVALLAVACSPTTDSSRTTLRDVEGKPVVMKHLPVQRLVSTMQSATEWLVLLGAGNALVARTDFDHQPELAALPSIGGGQYPSAEGIMGLSPEIVIGWKDRSSVDLAHALAPFKIPVISFETTDTADALRNLKLLGGLVGKEAKADSLANELRIGLARVRESACDSGSMSTLTTAFIIISDEPPMTAGGPTWMTTLLETTCLSNAFADAAVPWPIVSMEAITARQPTWIVTSSGKVPGAGLDRLRAKAGWRELEAVRAGRVIEVSSDLLSRPGPTMPEAARAIVAERRRIAGK